MKKFFALIVFGCVTGIFSTSIAGEAKSPPSRLNNCATLCPACVAAGGVCIHFPDHCSCE